MKSGFNFIGEKLDLKVKKEAFVFRGGQAQGSRKIRKACSYYCKY
jgi:hypothetical protein